MEQTQNNPTGERNSFKRKVGNTTYNVTVHFNEKNGTEYRMPVVESTFSFRLPLVFEYVIVLMYKIFLSASRHIGSDIRRRGK